MHRRSVTAAVSLVTLLTTPLVLASPAGAAPSAEPARTADFNGDGYADLVLGAPGGTVGGKAHAGYVSVVYGSSAGLDTAHPQIVSRATPQVPGDPEEHGNFGRAQPASADLDGDGNTDLVVPREGGQPSTVLWGSKDGLREATALSSEARDFAAGDFDGDGTMDLVTDAYPDNDNDEAGMTVMYGPFDRGATPARSDAIATSQTFGPLHFIVGDVTGDGADEIVTSHGFEEMQYKSQLWKGGSGGVSHTSTGTGHYTVGGVVADVNRDGHGDLVAREVDEVSETMEYDAGAVRVVYGSANGLSSRTAKITQSTPGVPGASEPGDGDRNYGDQFGYTISAGDVTGDGYPDIAAGVPGEDLDGVEDAGAAVLLKGGANGLTGTGAQAFNQSSPGVPGASEKDDAFGTAVSLLDVNANDRADLAAAAPGEDGTYADSGAAWLLRGSRNGLITSGIASFGPAALGAPEKNAELGRQIAR
ncbi:FG-GAP-like repeat-containing protein [Streptomyces monticola]|uniref:FG-GAP-like repeat-containing protein n=1 Tax=Streptomyces monticola TaxID=2666263 RepID=A0ABW2JNG8_9ACTN